MPGKPSKIPVGTQFTPALIDLEAFLAACKKHSGDKPALVAAVWTPAVRVKPPAKKPTPRQGSLPLEAAVQYGLLEPKTYAITPLGLQLQSLSGTELDEEFARHILLNLGGLRVVEAAQQMRLDGLNVTGDSLSRYLSEQGFLVVEHNTAINSLRMWLAKVGLFEGKTFVVDGVRKQQILGLDDETIASLVGLNAEQRAFAIALCRINPPPDYPAAEVRNMAEGILGEPIARASLPKSVLIPLKEAGLIDYTTGGTGGGKTSRLTTTTKFQAEVLEPFLTETTKTLDSALTAYYKKPPDQIYAELNSPDVYVKGKALEAYVVHLMRLIGLRFVGWRRRPQPPGGAELDVLLTGLMGNLPTRWQVQCKNTPKGTVDLEDVAKEVGLVPVTKATHVMVVANCKFTRDAIAYSHEIMRETPLTIFLLDRKDFDRIQSNPGDLPTILKLKSQEAAELHNQGIWLPS